ncbi:glycosyltransferase family A protein [Hydrogenovibrio sp. 3SP14C1]|uniref:glycosyltransferase family 2 protein n=1 Tax=Hydrogenovibrio sp. 3SP14C1 TaxID=3038774 RepID=UPI002416F71E|nr:glycosyltransferase family A protein [Hydrogenovibrio sp. 3SP14C1]MDG4812241.1 glycosyltransferase family A protein [Hydrogenovibrio sp. 3SP14C1]
MPYKPLVCICIPCYNNQDTIHDTLNSIVQQDYDNFKIKIFDNASTDNSREIVRSFIDQGYPIELHTREQNVSGEENFNICINAAEGSFCAIFHSDDVYEPDIISSQVAFLTDRENCQAVSVHAKIINENGQYIGDRMIPEELRRKASQEIELSRDELIELSFKYGNFITCPSVLFRTDILKNHIKEFKGGGFKSSADLNVWFRLTEKGSFGFINRPLINYRLSSSSFSYNLARVRKDDHDLFLVLDDFLKHQEQGNNSNVRLQSYRNFLLMKDRANTNLNRLILGNKAFQAMELGKNFPMALRSRFHFKYFMIALITKVIISLPFKQRISILMKRVKFGND